MYPYQYVIYFISVELPRAISSSKISSACVVEDPEFLGDGKCDYGAYNTAECQYDNGDCCSLSCSPGLHHKCGSHGYDCKDPKLECAVDDSKLLGNGKCDGGAYNTLNCDFDHGDCCVETSTGLQCGEYGYERRDPYYFAFPKPLTIAGRSIKSKKSLNV